MTIGKKRTRHKGAKVVAYPPPQFHYEEEAHVKTLHFSGAWVTSLMAGVLKQAISPTNPTAIDIEQVTQTDLNGAMAIRRIARLMGGQEAQWRGDLGKIAAEKPQSFKDQSPLRETPKNFSYVYMMIESLGRKLCKGLELAPQGISFFGLLMVSLAKVFITPHKIRFSAVAAQLIRVGIGALPIVTLIAFLIGIVLTFQGAFQLRRFGAEIFTVDLLAISVLRELGVLLTSIVVAGRSGSAFTAQIGTMKLNQEVDALETMGVDIMSLLILPRVIALLIALPLLTFLANMIALIGGALMSKWVLDISFVQFAKQLQHTMTMWTFWLGIFKAPFFAFLIAMVGCYEGLNVKGSADSVGSQTTKSVVEGIFLVLICDALFSILFALLGV